jgi:hypothetical protein
MVRVCLADDQALVRSGIRALLEAYAYSGDDGPSFRRMAGQDSG